MNNFLTFMLNMSDDQIRFLTNYTVSHKRALDNYETISSNNNSFSQDALKQEVRKLKN